MGTDLDEGELSQTTPIEAQTLACDRCRQRKTRCSRSIPCAQCTRAKAPCSYEQGRKSRPKRQRLRVSDNLEANISHIMARLDDLSGIMIETRSKVDELLKKSNLPRACIADSLETGLSAPGSTTHVGVEGNADGLSHSPRTEYEGESSLFGHAQFAATFLQNAIGANTCPEIRGEMTSVLGTLHDIVESQKQKSDTLESVFPHAKLLISANDLRGLSLPPMEKIFNCLRMVEEYRNFLGMWLYEFQSLDQFTHYVIRMCSSGPPTELEQVIVFAGLYWLFYECSSLVTDADVRKDYIEQAFLCRDNLETVLLNIRFHVPSSLDFVYAMSVSATYCLQISKISSAWMFICTAVHSAQALGYHSAVSVRLESEEKKSQTSWLFWAIYTTERLLALRIGRSSTVRDQDITIPPIQPSHNCDSYIRTVFPTWIKIAQIQGRLYDDLYSPGSLSQPEHNRVSRAYELAADIKTVMEIESQLMRKFGDVWVMDQQRGLNALVWKLDRLINLSTLTLVYRGIKSSTPGQSISNECLDAARAALTELNATLDIFAREVKNSRAMTLHINWSLVQSPFVPFTALFCHVIETSNSSDLEYLRQCIESLELMVAHILDATAKNFLRLFKALYDAAVRYIDAHSKSGQVTGLSPWASEGSANATAATRDSGIEPFALAQFPHNETSRYHQVPGSNVTTSAPESQDQLSLGLFGAGVDPQSSNPGNWYYNHHQLMRMLDDM